VRYVRAAFAALFLFACLAEAVPSYSFTVMRKSWVEIPKEFQHQAPSWKSHVGTWQNSSRNKQNNVYIHRIDRMGWKYSIKDSYGKFYTLYAGSAWTWTPGDLVILTGGISSEGVFIPQGAKDYGR